MRSRAVKEESEIEFLCFALSEWGNDGVEYIRRDLKGPKFHIEVITKKKIFDENSSLPL
jgi:hypothetical protein